jgi:hypothetical protein
MRLMFRCRCSRVRRSGIALSSTASSRPFTPRRCSRRRTPACYSVDFVDRVLIGTTCARRFIRLPVRNLIEEIFIANFGVEQILIHSHPDGQRKAHDLPADNLLPRSETGDETGVRFSEVLHY